MIIIVAGLRAQNLPGNVNLVPNGGFEFNTISGNEIINDTILESSSFCWIKANAFGSSIRQLEDYDKQTPGNPWPLEGKNSVELMIGLFDSFNVHQPLDVQLTSQGKRAYIQTRLLEPLVAGQTYYFTMYVGNSRNTKFSSPQFEGQVILNLGVLFTKTQVKDYHHSSFIDRVPQIRFSDWPLPQQLDSFQFVKLSGVYTGSGGEEYITIGNFDTLQSLNIAHINPDLVRNDTLFSTWFRSYIDNISLVSDTSLPLILPNEQWSLGKDTVICTGGLANPPITLGDSSFFLHYIWSTGDTTSTLTIQESGTYWCSVDFGCNTYTDTIQVMYLDEALPLIDLGPDTTICNGYDHYDSRVLKVSDCMNCQILWNTGETSEQITIHRPDQYWVRAENVCGAGSDSISISGCPEKGIPKVWLPNAFSPNGDGINDRFCAPFLPVQVISATLTIFNRWAQKVITLDNVSSGWDGLNADIGIYYYELRYLDVTNKHHIQKGEISLIR